jgi:hypothetical protein
VSGWLTQSAGKNKEGEEASGTINVPEVAHDTEESEYVVCSLSSQSSSFVRSLRLDANFEPSLNSMSTQMLLASNP